MYLIVLGVRQILLLATGLAATICYSQVDARSLTPAKALREPGIDSFAVF